MYKFKSSEEIVKGVGSAIVTLKGQHIAVIDDSGESYFIYDPSIIIDLLSFVELKRYAGLSELSTQMKADAEEVIVRDKVVEIIGSEGMYLNIMLTPAGVISTLADIICRVSYDYIDRPKDQYGIHVGKVNFIEQMCAIVAHYMNIPFYELEKLPLSEIFRLHSICHMAFPAQVNDIRNDIGSGNDS